MVTLHYRGDLQNSGNLLLSEKNPFDSYNFKLLCGNKLIREWIWHITLSRGSDKGTNCTNSVWWTVFLRNRRMPAKVVHSAVAFISCEASNGLLEFSGWAKVCFWFSYTTSTWKFNPEEQLHHPNKHAVSEKKVVIMYSRLGIKSISLIPYCL